MRRKRLQEWPEGRAQLWLCFQRGERPAALVEAGLGGGADVGFSGGLKGDLCDGDFAVEAVDFGLALGHASRVSGLLLLAGELGLGVIVRGLFTQGLFDGIAAAFTGGEEECCKGGCQGSRGSGHASGPFQEWPRRGCARRCALRSWGRARSWPE